jgi:cobalt-zinc-cadmium efflux system membrane fusion protein
MNMKKPIIVSLVGIVVVLTLTIIILQVGINESEAVKTEVSITGHDDHDGHNHADQISTEEVFDWCAEHRVPESECTLCHPELIDSFKSSGDWCAGHGIPESHCRLCNPGIQFPQEIVVAMQDTDITDWCTEHRVPESECTLCHPELIDSFKSIGDWCAGHDIPESHCRLCNPDIQFPQELVMANQELEFDIKADEIEVSLFFRENSSVCATNDALIQFASNETVTRSGITVHKTRSAQLENTVEAPAETVFDEKEFTVVTISVPALVSRWLVSPGKTINKGEALAVLNSPEIAELQSSFISANAEYEVQKKELSRHEQMKSRNLISEADYDRQKAMTEKARADLTGARGLLTAAGMNDHDINDVLDNGTVSSQLLLRASESGKLVERIAKIGELLVEGSAYALLADPSSMWIEARLPEQQLRYVNIGDKLTFTSDGRGLNQVGAEVIWVAQFLDPHTRTGIVRASIIDPSHNLQAGEFGRVRIQSTHESEVTLVLKDAVQWEGCCNVVFVKETNSRYRPRKIELVESSGPYYQVTRGLTPGEEIVVEGAFLLKTELKKTSIGAGCCDIEPAG